MSEFEGAAVEGDGAGFYDETDFYGEPAGGAQVTPELVAQVAAQMAAQQEAPPAAPQQPAFDPVLQAHADHMLEAVPELRDPNSHEVAAFTKLVQERANQAGIPEAAGDMRFARSVFDSLEPGALRPQQDRVASAIMGDGRLGSKVLPY